MRITEHFVNGRPYRGDGDRVSAIYSPARGIQTGAVRLASQVDVQHVVDVARAAFDGWAATPSLRRARILFKYLVLLEAHKGEVAKIISCEHGKTHEDALGEVQRGIEVVEFACGIPQLLKGQYSEDVGRGVDAMSLRQPLGVVVGITPFNFPAMVPMWMFPIAIACGNSFILKPSEKVPGASLLLATLLKEAGLPDGVFNVIQGDEVAVDGLLEHPDTKAVSFVGSTPIAHHIYRTAAEHGMRVQALGGAKNHMVVMPDADMGQAADALIGAAFGSAGERCMAISVAVPVGEGTADALLNALIPKAERLRVGPATDDVDMGPLITEQHLTNVLNYVSQGVSQGADLVLDGREGLPDSCREGFFLGPCIFDNVSTEMTIYKEEIFGPVLSVLRAADLPSAIEIVNAHRFGNGTSIYTLDGRAARRFAHEIQAGMVGVNIPIPVPMAFHSFGGWKESMFGDQHMHGEEGVRFYTKAKAITTRWPAGTNETSHLAMQSLA